MAKIADLPPPPVDPERSPPASVAGEELIVLPGLPGEPSLEARIRAPLGATRAVVLCHPHPLYGGTMHSAVIVAIAKVLAEQRGDSAASIRFNYRGVGTSGGAYGHGVSEVADVRAAIREMRKRAPNAALTVCGYSFGTGVGLKAAALEDGIDRVVLVAPAVRIFNFLDGKPPPAVPIFIVAAENDDYCDVAEAEQIADAFNAQIQVVPGADHFFLKGRRKLAEVVLPLIAPLTNRP